MKHYIEPTTQKIFSFDDDVENIFAFPSTPKTLVSHTPLPLTETEILVKKELATQTSLMNLCDKKQADVLTLILGYKATPMQLERYKDKYERAKANEWDTVTNDSIISNYESYLTAMRNLVDLIEYFRSAVDDLIIDGELDKASEVITAAESFDETTTLTQVQELFLSVK